MGFINQLIIWGAPSCLFLVYICLYMVHIYGLYMVYIWFITNVRSCSNFALGICSRNRTGATCQYFAVHMFGLRICLLKKRDSQKKPSLTFKKNVWILLGKSKQ